MPDDGNAAKQDIKNVCIGRCFFTYPSTRFKALDLFVNENLAFRNNLLHNAGAVAPCVTYRGSDANTTASDNYRIENNVFVVQASGNLFSTALAWQFQAVASSTQTGVTFKNNLLVASAADDAGR